jgi:hypothetical protein
MTERNTEGKSRCLKPKLAGSYYSLSLDLDTIKQHMDSSSITQQRIESALSGAKVPRKVEQRPRRRNIPRRNKTSVSVWLIVWKTTARKPIRLTGLRAATRAKLISLSAKRKITEPPVLDEILVTCFNGHVVVYSGRNQDS